MFYNITNSERRSGDSATVINPRTSESLWEVPVGRETDLNDAVEAARVSFESWKLLSIEERQKYLLRLADELEHRRDEVQPPLAGETGKSNLLANMEIDDTLAFIRFNGIAILKLRTISWLGKLTVAASQSLPDKVDYETETLKIVSTHPPIGVDEVIPRVNGTCTGLGACVWANDVGTAERIARKIEVGTAWINSAEAPNPYGFCSGWKQSGIGGEWGSQPGLAVVLSHADNSAVQVTAMVLTREMA